MTISSTTVKNSYSGDSSTTTFTYTFKIFADSDIQVIIRSSTGTETTKTITTHYTVTGAGVSAGGTVIFTGGNIPVTGETVILRRNIPQTQAIDYIANDPFPAESHEEGLDRATMAIQQIQEEVTRSIKLSKTNTMTSTEFTVGAAARANKILAFDTNGEIAVTQELGTYRGNWATATSYAARDLVKDTSTNNIFIVNTAHTSSGSQPLTTNANSAYYELIVDAASASASATAAAASAATATTQAGLATTNGAAQVTLATAQVALATTQATNAASSASTASTQASNASASATAAQAAQAAAELALDNFDDIYLGAFATNPTLDNDGGALTAGDLYFNTASSALQVYSGSAWQAAAVSTAGFATLTGAETFTNKTLTSPIINTAITLNATGELRLADTDSSNYVGFKSPGTVSTNKIWTLPSADGSANQALTTNGSGVLSFADAGRTGAVNWDTTAKTTGFTAVSGNGYFCNTTSSAFTVTLPLTPAAGAIVAIADYANTFATNNITVGRNSSNIGGFATNAILSTNGLSVTFVYVDLTQGWIVTDSGNRSELPTPQYVAATGGTVTTSGDYKIHTFTGPGTFTVSSAGNSAGSNSVDYLVVAGGGGSGRDNGGGGGAGGFRYSNSTFTVSGAPGAPLASATALPVTATGYPITVGAGGGTCTPLFIGIQGNPSVFSTITSTGGGFGVGCSGNTPAPIAGNGQPGGSGGGAGQISAGPGPKSGGSGNTPPVSPSQGNNGGGSSSNCNGGAAGGSAMAVGSTCGPKVGGVGAGLPTAFGSNGVPSGGFQYYAGGGGGGAPQSGGAAGAGGLGGGGAGAPGSCTAGTAGTANTGGGAGGGSQAGNGAAGGSGIIVIRYKFQ